jgi:CDP-diacylglycerol--glycerol-3-phosphate 3-phosphatidyltransferase
MGKMPIRRGYASSPRRSKQELPPPRRSLMETNAEPKVSNETRKAGADRMNLPNILTAMRIMLAPISVLFLFWNGRHKDLIAAGFFILAALTDGLDGWAARARKQTTQFGKSFDPFADKVLIAAALVSLAKLHRVYWWMVWVIVSREIFVTILRQFAGQRGQAIGASWLGKAKTVSQLAAITSIILFEHSLPRWPRFSACLLWMALLLTVFSGLDYIIRWRFASPPAAGM